MKAIKFLVLFMGFLIVIGIGLVVYAVVFKPSKTQAVTPPNVSAPGQTIPTPMEEAAPGQIPMKPRSAYLPVPIDMPDLNLGQPEGSRIVATSSGRGRLFITIEGGGIAARVVIIDLSSNQISGTVRIGGAP